jgi:hypothetical protein
MCGQEYMTSSQHIFMLEFNAVLILVQAQLQWYFVDMAHMVSRRVWDTWCRARTMAKQLLSSISLQILEQISSQQ